MKNSTNLLIFLAIISFVIMGCAKSDDSTTTTTTTTDDDTVVTTGTNTPILSGMISSSSSSSSRTLSEARNFSHLLGRSSERTSYSSHVSNCTAKAYDPTDDSLKATVTAADNGTYTFTDSQLTKGVMYKVSVECTYGGVTVKMSTYGAASSSLDNVTTADIDPQSTATAAYVKKALVKAVVKGLSSTTATGTVAEKKRKNSW